MTMKILFLFYLTMPPGDQFIERKMVRCVISSYLINCKGCGSKQ